ncbi:YbaB/EbfC family nucleoid-associated protein [Gordonia alkaliphila]|uniref:YbaB/EbfC family nucleoid-associated protein n=1 Tax=Gordonia alkaliphila TaxID=1053547 RepID=UPI001FF6D51B|nr:YbaB/EbfC family nucleoid-associated protein [Gordonia alkaliphila]MCK0438323.1 YbaB/EbfC family nucleoid-associated protein [Gordonia alkaliphila]
MTAGTDVHGDMAAGAMDRITARAAAQLAVLEQVRGDLAALSSTASVDDGRVTVRLDAGGGLADLQLAPGAGQGDAERLGRLITEAAAAADLDLCAARDELLAAFTEQFDDTSGEFADTPGTEGTGSVSATSNCQPTAVRERTSAVRSNDE